MTKFHVFYYDVFEGTIHADTRADASRQLGIIYRGRVGVRIVEAAPTYDPDISCTLTSDGCFYAIDRNNYIIDCDHTGFYTGSPTGRGRTPLDAIVDLLDETP